MIKMVSERENIEYYIKNDLGSLMPTGSKSMELFVEEDNAEVCLTILQNKLGLK
jgi:hypothetical protein